MGVCALILGDSGSGKSTSLRNFEEGEVGIFNVMGKPLPFRKKLTKADHADYDKIMKSLAKNALRAYVIDDAGYLMSLENFARAKETGYTKFTDMAQKFERLIEAATKTDEDTIVYLFMHYDKDADGRMKPESIGRMLDEKFCEGACPIVIQSVIEDGKYRFVTKGDGFNAAKAPMDMLPDTMDNDLKAVDTAIREYWGMALLVDKPKGKPVPKAGDAA